MGTDKKIKVCHLISGDLWAGAEAQISMLLSQLSKEKHLENFALIYNQGRLAEELKRLNISLYILEEKKNNPVKLFIKTYRWLKHQDVDLVHSHRYKENVIGSLAAKMGGIHHIIRTYHGMPEPFGGFKNIKYKSYIFLDYLVSRLLVKQIITASFDMKKKLDPKLGEKKVVSIPNSVNLGSLEIKKPPRRVREMLGVDSDCRIIGSAGRLVPIKGYQVFLKAAQLIKKKESKVKFLIVGDGPEKSNLERLADQLKISGDFLFLGHREDILDIINAMDIFVLTSFHEGIPMVLLEAMGLEKPVVATNVGGIPEVVTDQVSGVLVKPNDPESLAERIVSLMQNRKVREKMGSEAKRIIAEYFTTERMAKRVLEIYESMVR
jgi:glycosyltransferase involved in cell wall biosynthesis